MLLVAVAVLSAAGPARAAEAMGIVQRSFAMSGTALVPYGSTAGAAAVVVQPDGKIVTAGQTTVNGQNKIIVTRMTATGAQDPTFGTNGIVTVAVNGGAGMDSGAGLALQPDGKIVIAGLGNQTIYGPQAFAAIRLNPDGSLDQSFGAGGYATVNVGGVQSIANAVVIQPNGKIVLAGTANVGHKAFAAARLNPDGSLDTSFGDHGTITLSPNGAAWGLALQSNGKLVIAGQTDYDNPSIPGAQQFMAARLTSGGHLDATYGDNGIAKIPVGGTALGFGVAVQPDGKAVLAGIAWTYTNMNATVRLTTRGQLDSTYGHQGMAMVPDGHGVNGIVLDSSGAAILPAVGPSVLRIDADGTPDQSFGNGSIVDDPVGSGGGANGAAVGPDGKIVIAGAATVDGQDQIFVSRVG